MLLSMHHMWIAKNVGLKNTLDYQIIFSYKMDTCSQNLVSDIEMSGLKDVGLMSFHYTTNINHKLLKAHKLLI